MPRINGHTIRWYGRVPANDEYPDGYVPRTSMMRGRDWGWDVRCSCGWESRTGGAIQERVREMVDDHLGDVAPPCECQHRYSAHVGSIGCCWCECDGYRPIDTAPAVTIKLIDGDAVTGWYDDSWPGRDGTGPERKVRLLTTYGSAVVLEGTTMSDRMRVVRYEDVGAK